VAGAALWLGRPACLPGQVLPPAVEPTGRVIGTVLDRQTGEPVTAARIVLLDRSTAALLGATASDALGGFALPPVQPGTYDLRVEQLGYRSVTDSVSVEKGADEVITIYLASEAIDLEPLVVRVDKTTAFFMRDFERRRTTGSGTFITRSQIERRRANKASEILHSLGGVRVQYSTRGEAALFVRGQCRPQVFVDGVALHGSVSLDMAVLPDDIEGMEVYSSASIPAQYTSTGACAVILVWTRPAVRGEGRKVSVWKLLATGAVFLTVLLLKH
jgi:hypothetical protein